MGVRCFGEAQAILLRVTGLDTLDANAETQPPDGELAQAEQSMRRSEGHAVIAENVSRQATFLKEPLKHRKRISFAS